MRNRKILLGLFGMMLNILPSLEGAVFSKIDTTVPLKCVFSNEHQNRIIVDKGRIEKVIFTDDALAVRLEEESGQVFVYLTHPKGKEIVLSVVTESGIVQDLEICFEEKSSEIVILQKPESQKALCQPHDIEQIIETILAGQSPKGYCCFDGGESRMVQSQIFLNAIARFEGNQEIINLFRIENKAAYRSCLIEQELCSPSTNWVYLVKRELSPHEETIAIVAESRVR